MITCDMDTDEWRNRFNPGEEWLSTKPYECEYCGLNTNRWHMIAPSWIAPKLLCQGQEQMPELHQELKEKVKNSREKRHPRQYLEALQNDIIELKRHFLGIKPDIKTN